LVVQDFGLNSHVGPYRVKKFVPGHQLPRVFQQTIQDAEFFWRQGDALLFPGVRVPPQALVYGIEAKRGEFQIFH
jgi:hypothetical protein